MHRDSDEPVWTVGLLLARRGSTCFTTGTAMTASGGLQSLANFNGATTWRIPKAVAPSTSIETAGTGAVDASSIRQPADDLQ